jgi:MarR family transcriptional regulator, organic hydroperoxide resistance regulator
MSDAGEAGREAWGMLARLWLSDENHDRFHDACAAVDLSPPQLKALLSLAPGEAKAMRVLADQWRCDASWVTGLVDGLEERGFAERQVLASDRRVKTVVLTPRGRRAQQRALARLEEPPAALDVLTDAEKRRLRDLLERVVDAARARSDEDSATDLAS